MLNIWGCCGTNAIPARRLATELVVIIAKATHEIHAVGGILALAAAPTAASMLLAGVVTGKAVLQPFAREVVEAHGGTIGVSEVQPHGSCFWFTLPAQ